jgi:uncharacterized protein (DUF305 family)
MRPTIRYRTPLVALAIATFIAALGVALVMWSSGQSASAASEPGHAHPTPKPSATRTLSERAFLDLMIPHHEMAVEMSDIAMRTTKDDYVVDVATDVLTQQPWEIRLMTKWRKDWFGVAADARHTMTEAEMHRYGMSHDMAALESAKPFREAYFRAMIPHHQGGIVMAREVLRTKPRAEVARLARSIIVSQQQDISRMKKFLRGEGWATPPTPSGKPPTTP